MYATMGGQFMRMHPVIIMAPKLQSGLWSSRSAPAGTIPACGLSISDVCCRKALIMLFSSLLGVTGMFLATWLQGRLSGFCTASPVVSSRQECFSLCSGVTS